MISCCLKQIFQARLDCAARQQVSALLQVDNTVTSESIL